MFIVLSWKNGSTTAELTSGIKIMSDSLMPFQPETEEPSNILPSTKVSASTTEVGTVTCCSLPRVSVKRKSIYLISSSFICFSTSEADIDLPQ